MFKQTVLTEDEARIILQEARAILQRTPGDSYEHNLVRVSALAIINVFDPPMPLA